MFYAYNAVGRKVSTEEADPQYTYTCCQCGRTMIVKGTELTKKEGTRRKHFAHPKVKDGEIPCPESVEGWRYHKNDMTEWHKNWQKRFPDEYKEIWKQGSEGKVRADVLLPYNMTVVELQTSPIRREEWERRNRAYNELGYTVIWLFDKRSAVDADSWDASSYPGKYGVQFGPFYPQNEKEILVFIEHESGYEPMEDGEYTQIRQLRKVKSGRGGRYQIEYSRPVSRKRFLEFCLEPKRNEGRTERKPEKTAKEDSSERNKTKALSVYDWFRIYPKARKIRIKSTVDSRQYWVYQNYMPRRKGQELKGWRILPYQTESRLEAIWYAGEPRWILLNVTE